MFHPRLFHPRLVGGNTNPNLYMICTDKSFFNDIYLNAFLKITADSLRSNNALERCTRCAQTLALRWPFMRRCPLTRPCNES